MSQLDGMDRTLEFQTIQLPRDEDICVRFRRDAYACSFVPERFEIECGRDGRSYRAWLAANLAEFPQGFVHVWRKGEIVGQMEMRPHGEPRIGYINLFYLVPELRGSGLSDSLHAYAVSVFAALGFDRLQLSVTPLNVRAQAFYRKYGWRDLGPHPGFDAVHLFELSLPAGG